MESAILKEVKQKIELANNEYRTLSFLSYLSMLVFMLPFIISLFIILSGNMSERKIEIYVLIIIAFTIAPLLGYILANTVKKEEILRELKKVYFKLILLNDVFYKSKFVEQIVLNKMGKGYSHLKNITRKELFERIISSDDIFLQYEIYNNENFEF